MEARIFGSYTWAPPQGGTDCYKCGEGIIPCTKYQCQSLGEGCELLKEDEGEGTCIHTNPNDIEPPIIKPWEDALKNSDYSYSPDNTISPPDKGVIVKYKDLDCGIPAYEIFSFGVQLVNDIGNAKLGRCKYSFTRKDSYENMSDLFLSNRKSKSNHSISFKLSGVENLEAEDIEGTGEHTIYIRCENRNGYANDENFVFKFCMDKGPDMQAPIIEETNPLNGKPIQFGQTSVLTKVFTNEPADCRWSHTDEEYDEMTETMNCSQSMVEMNANMLYKCTTTLTGMKDEVENKFYFRCRDQPVGVADEDRNTNPTYVYTRMGTRPLVIDSVTANGFPTGATIKDSTISVKVTLKAVTSAGYKDGQAWCKYKKKTDADTRYNLFDNTNSYQSTQDLWFERGDYKYTIKCEDAGGNPATQEIDFSVDTDFLPPVVTRAYNEGDSLKIITDENADCVYDTTSCSYDFEDGIKMTSSDGLAHTTKWDTKNNLYIKCKDEYGVQPTPNDQCSITVRPFNTY